jgi:predicted O-methyltransferase YrrM
MNLTFADPLETALNAALNGREIQQHEWELREFFSRVLADLKPQRTVELGTYKGWMAMLLSHVTTGQTVSLDIHDYGTQDARSYGHNLALVIANACNPATPQQIVDTNFSGQPIDLLFIDDGHYYEDDVVEFKIWKPMVRPGGWICFHDINPLANIGPHGVQPPECQTARFWQELTGNKEEIIATEKHKIFRGPIPHGGIGILRV